MRAASRFTPPVAADRSAVRLWTHAPQLHDVVDGIIGPPAGPAIRRMAGHGVGPDADRPLRGRAHPVEASTIHAGHLQPVVSVRLEYERAVRDKPVVARTRPARRRRVE